MVLHETGLVWLRRDLRLHDHAALALALARCRHIHVAFVLDTGILAPLPRNDRRVAFIRDTLAALDEALRALAGRAACGLIVRHGVAADVVPELAMQLGASAVFASHDDEPASLARDNAVRTALTRQRCEFHTVKDHVVFERRDLLTQGGTPYTVFTPYARAWRARLSAVGVQTHSTDELPGRLADRPDRLAVPVPTLGDIGFTSPHGPPLDAGPQGARAALQAFWPRAARYDTTRDVPALDSTSRLGVHLRFGTLSIRELVALAAPTPAPDGTQRPDDARATWLNELIWRDFFAQIMAHFPHAMTGAFRAEYDALAWEQGAAADAHFAAWCDGRTGYPIVDAAMRQLNNTGFMHNRVRMVAASFLVKDLGLDWRRGEAYFADRLDDFDLASNNGNWQWAASTGCDAQPWFRIFNPVLQARKFDPRGEFIRQWLPELGHLPTGVLHDFSTLAPLERASLPASYPATPCVDHAEARERTLARYGAVRGAAGARAS